MSAAKKTTWLPCLSQVPQVRLKNDRPPGQFAPSSAQQQQMGDTGVTTSISNRYGRLHTDH